ncbi:phage tail sheath protein [Clostridium botulinum]|uniref:phage tail sheath C-terminal domain-containing protein n=1 Tax=Clostridium botulinum TaxID=1491 RepID=UPI0005F8DE92|nr:phage tail sheath C-terminal domain-containing protein [Clostridium botulinum]MBY6799545.1 phage tail sheath protein [Clostridium botulinum]NFF20892.1 phage tail sheath protein [Clostridium botulinum]NFM75498.1 phage tail sheath protein [Clostridium botulinum]NFP81050.1 phage tail sheath protein [Clostridium botulinum]NFP94022.1 phage tail sheath protein [Clostridium botulinum]
MNTLPDINILFKQRAATFTQRGGVAILLLKDDTDKNFNTAEYKTLTDLELDEAKYTPTNLQYIKDTLLGKPSKVVVVRVDVEKEVTDALNIVKNLYSTGWVSLVSETKTDYDTLVSWIKTRRDTDKKTFKAIVFYPTTPPDYEGVVVLGNEKVIFKDNTRGEKAGYEFLPTLLGYIASAGVDTGTTYMAMENLKTVSEPASTNQEIQAGKLILINDENIVKIGLGVNSLTTFTQDKEDFSLIEVIETMDLIKDDIRKTFKNNYIGKFKNKLDNQMLFVSAVNTYFSNLAARDVLDSSYNNESFIDVEAQRKAWVDSGKPEAKEWDDTTVKNTTFKRKLFLGANIKILTSMTDLTLVITME